MGRAPCCDKANVKKGPWSPEEDAKLKAYIEKYGTGGNWIALPQKIGLSRCGKSCRLRWLNYLRPNIRHGGFSEEEDNIICSLYLSIGSRWSIIAAQLPGRTDNDIKNYWNTRLKKKLLGKQRKDQRARSASFLKQEMKRETEIFLAVEAINKYPELQQPVVLLPAIVPQQEAAHAEDQAAPRNLLTKQGANFFGDYHQSNRNFINNQNNLYVHEIPFSTAGEPCENSLSVSSTSTSLNSLRGYCPMNGMIGNNFQYYNFSAELDEIEYNDQQQLDGLDSFSGMDIVNRSTVTTTSPESTSFEDISSLVCPDPVVFNYNICQQPIPQDYIFEESRLLELQQQQYSLQ